MAMRAILFGMLGSVAMCCWGRELCAVDEVIALRNAEVRFDFCGVSTNSGHKVVFNELQRKHLATLISLDSVHYVERQKFLQGATDFESAIAERRLADKEKAIKLLSDMFAAMRMKAQTDNVRDYSLIMEFILRIEYSLARIIESPHYGLLEPSDIERLLPRMLFDTLRTKPSNVGQAVGRKEAFRDMLVIALALRQCGDNLPEMLSELRLPLNLISAKGGMSFHYERQGKVWQLIWSGSNMPKNPFNCYIPSLGGKECSLWFMSGCVFLSSDFSAKRMRLYNGATLNEQDAWLKCHMTNGRIERVVSNR